MNRRKFVTYGTGGLFGLAVGGFRRPSLSGEPVHAAGASPREIRLRIEQTILPMVDGRPVYAWAFRGDDGGPRVPGPVLRVTQGESLRFIIDNKLDEPHRFAIAGVAETADIAPGAEAVLDIPAPAPGTYAYLDPLNAPANRVLGLHGVLIVLPAAPAPGHNLTPYANPTAPMQRLFDDLSKADSTFATPTATGRIAGGPWNPARHGKDLVWVFTQIDPRWNDKAQQGIPVSGQALRADFVPRYFTLNGKSGYYSATDPDTAPHGAVGEPVLIRCFMAGIGCQAPHIHGNHIFELTRRTLADAAVVPLDCVRERDTWMMDEGRLTDVLLPYHVPPDIWPWPPQDLHIFERQLPLYYPMHCHNQPSNTAAGGMYPQGTITHWGITGIPGVTKIVHGGH
jgi:hypothetical protein